MKLKCPNLLKPLKCGFCKKLLIYECNSDQFPTFFHSVINFGWVCCYFAVAPTQKWWQNEKKWATGQSCIRKEVTSYKIHTLGTLIQENYWSFYPSEPFRIPCFNMRHPVLGRSGKQLTRCLCFYRTIWRYTFACCGREGTFVHFQAHLKRGAQQKSQGTFCGHTITFCSWKRTYR